MALPVNLALMVQAEVGEITTEVAMAELAAMAAVAVMAVMVEEDKMELMV